jgi:feruloyl esterase
MLHCGGGDGVSQFGGTNDSRPIGDAQHDLLTALTQWVEAGKAPASIIGSRIEAGKVVRERPLCPYPQQAVYRGGNPDQASSFQCSAVGEQRR